LNEKRIRRLAADFILDTREGERRGAPPPVIDPRIVRHEAEFERFLGELHAAGDVLRRASALPLASALPGAPSPVPRRANRRRTRLLAAAAIALATVKIGAMLLSSPRPAPSPRAEFALAPLADPDDAPADEPAASRTVRTEPAIPAEPAPRAMPANELSHATASADPARSADPIVLHIEGLDSVLYAIGRRRPPQVEGDLFRLDADEFCARILPRLDPIDQWRVHQAALAVLGHYPPDRIDGLFGVRTAQGLDAFFSDHTLRAIVRDGLLTPGAARALLGRIDRITVSLPRPEENPSNRPQGHALARTPATDEETTVDTTRAHTPGSGAARH
jgi:hypothetical protein